MLTIKTFKTSSLREYERNPRRNDHAVDKVVDAIRAFGFRVPIIAKSDGSVVDGHLRLKAARKMGMAEVPVLIADDLSDAQIRAFRISVNKVADLAEWDDALLTEELRSLGEAGLNLEHLGFSTAELDALLLPRPEGLTDPDEVPDAPAVPVSQRGDLWILGNHRVMCGDSLSAEDVKHLLVGRVPDIAYCDPPYGISIVKGASVGGAKPFGKSGRVHGPAQVGPAKNALIQPGTYAPIIGDDTTETAVKSYQMLRQIGVPVIALWGGNYFADALPPSRCWLVWDKETTGTFADAELAWTNQDAVVRLLRHRWSGLMKASERGEKRVHPTQKPVALAEWVIETLAPKARSVIDLFLGSGSTLIAAQNRGLSCYGMEMSPDYVDAVVLRWQRYTGQRAILEATGESYDAVRDERAVSAEVAA